MAAQSRLEYDPSLAPVSPTSANDSCQGGTAVKPKGKVPAMFLANKKGHPTSKKIDPKLKLEWQLHNAINEVAQTRIERGKQVRIVLVLPNFYALLSKDPAYDDPLNFSRSSAFQKIQQILEEKTRLEVIEAKRQRRIVNAEQQRAKAISYAEDHALGLGRVSSRLRAQVKKPDYVVDSSLTDRQFERELRKFDQGLSDDSSTRKATGRKRREMDHDANDTDGEDKSWKEAADEDDLPVTDGMDVDDDDEFSTNGAINNRKSNGRHSARAKQRVENESAPNKVSRS